MRLFVFNGCLYYLNNQLNFLVLEKVNAPQSPLSQLLPSPDADQLIHQPHHHFRMLSSFSLHLADPGSARCGARLFDQVDAVTHGLINCGRRVANIGFAIVWFGIPVTLFNGIGMSLALIGAFCARHPAS